MINLINIARLDLNLLIVFHCLMNERSVTRTAVILCVSQGAISSSLKRLRDIFNDELFIRTNQCMVPTNYAMELAPKISLALNTISLISPEQEKFDPKTSNRVFKIALSDDLEGVLSKSLLKLITKNNLHVTFSFYQTSSQIFLQTYEQHDCDLLICAEPNFINHNFKAETLFSSSYSCLYDPEFHSASAFSQEDYFNCNHVRISYDARRGFIDDIFESNNVIRKVKASFTHFSGAMTAIIDTDIVATIPTFAAKYYASISKLDYCPVPIHVPSFRVFMVWNTNKGKDQDLIWLRNFISDIQFV